MTPPTPAAALAAALNKAAYLPPIGGIPYEEPQQEDIEGQADRILAALAAAGWTLERSGALRAALEQVLKTLAPPGDIYDRMTAAQEQARAALAPAQGGEEGQ